MRCLLALLLLLAGPAHAVELWGGVHAGMTIQQVKDVFPEAVPPSKPSVYAGGERQELEAPGPQLSGHPFTVAFVFKGPSLVDVRLKIQSHISYRQAGVLIADIEHALIAKYGAPMEWSHKPGGLMSTTSGQWRSNGILVSFLAQGVGDNPATIQIRYLAPAEASKL